MAQLLFSNDLSFITDRHWMRDDVLTLEAVGVDSLQQEEKVGSVLRVFLKVLHTYTPNFNQNSFRAPFSNTFPRTHSLLASTSCVSNVYSVIHAYLTQQGDIHWKMHKKWSNFVRVLSCSQYQSATGHQWNDINQDL